MTNEDRQSNSILIFFTSEEYQLLQNISDRNQYVYNWLKKLILEMPTVKQKYIETSGESAYNEALRKASRTIVQVKEENIEKKLGKRKQKIKTEQLMVEIETLSSEDDRKFLDFMNKNGINDMDFDDLSDKMKVEWFLKWKQAVEDAFKEFGKKVELV
jgi:hypothetical protein